GTLVLGGHLVGDVALRDDPGERAGRVDHADRAHLPLAQVARRFVHRRVARDRIHLGAGSNHVEYFHSSSIGANGLRGTKDERTAILSLTRRYEGEGRGQIFFPARMQIGIDLGGTKIEGIALGRDGRELVRTRVPAPRDHYDATLSAVVELVRSIEHETGARGTGGVGTPGTISPAPGVGKNAHSTWVNGRAPAHELPRLVGRAG